MEKNTKGINLSDIYYNEDGEIMFRDLEEKESDTNIENKENINPTVIDVDTPLTEDDKSTPMTSEEKAMSLSQTMEEIERDMIEDRKREKELNNVIYMNERNTMILSCCIFTLLGLSFGTFVFSDYITCTLIGLLLGVLYGMYLCKKIQKEDTEETETIREGENNV